MDNEFTRDNVAFRLRAIVREITCMSDATFAEGMKDGEMVFDRFNWGEQSKVQTKIKMTKTEVRND